MTHTPHDADAAEWEDEDEMPESQQKLLDHLRELDAPGWMFEKLWEGYYHDYHSPHAMPKMLLVKDARMLTDTESVDRKLAHSFIQNVQQGKYDDPVPDDE